MANLGDTWIFGTGNLCLNFMSKFKNPKFGDKCIELRFEHGEVCIYANRAGLKHLAAFCAQLDGKLQTGLSEHIHLEDMQVLTSESLRGTIAVFDAV